MTPTVEPPPTQPTQPARRLGPRTIGTLAVLLFAIVAVIAQQRFGPSHQPTATAAIIGSFFIWITVLPWLALWWLSASGWGGATARALRLDRSGGMIRLALGGATLMLLTWLVAWAIGLNRWTMATLLALGALFWIARHAATLRRLLANPDHAWSVPHPRIAAAFALACAAPAALFAVAITLPAGTLWKTEAFGYDVLSYHLNLPKQWLDAGRMIELEHDVYGYLPNLVEATCGLFFALRGATPQAVYLTQAFHASWALLAALLVGHFTFRLGGSLLAAALAAGTTLAVPWALITGSMAYNEMVVVALAVAAATLILHDSHRHNPTRSGIAVGLLVGVATLAKLTAGFMVAVPLGLMLLATRPLRNPWKAAACAAIAGSIVLTPYLLRNALWTGNPVFPFATDTLGLGHWTPHLAQRWNLGHGLAEAQGIQLQALARQWLFNTGYGAIGGWPAPQETQNIARFSREFGLPVLWISVAASSLLLAFRARPKSPTTPSPRPHVSLTVPACLLAWIAFQLLAWFFVTHLQSRFLVTTLAPAAMLVGLGLTQVPPALRWLWGTGLLASLTALSISLLWSQTVPGRDPDTGQAQSLPPWFLADAFASHDHPFHPDQHPINALPHDARVLIVADTSRLFYLQPHVVYASAFDASPLSPILDQTNTSHAAAQALRTQGITHLWVGWSELRRLHNTYGHDHQVSEAAVRQLTQSWPTVSDLGNAALYQIPNP